MKIITGASRGIGKYLINYFDKNGERVIGTYNHTKPDAEISELLFKVDITVEKDIEKLTSAITDKDESIVLINCAGINYNCIGHKSELEKWAKVVETNLIGTFKVIHAFLPLMRERGYGRIINFASIVAQKGIPGTSAYAASKSGMWGMARALAVENANKEITINNLNLGYFDIGLISEVPTDYQNVIKSTIPTKKFGDPKDILNAINFIIDNNYLNGTSIDINGGLY